MRLECGDGDCAWEIMATVSVAWVWGGCDGGGGEGKGKERGLACCRGVNEGGYNLLQLLLLNPHKHNQH